MVTNVACARNPATNRSTCAGVKPARARADATSMPKIAGTTIESMPFKSGDKYATAAA
jgi:hypothetical protein